MDVSKFSKDDLRRPSVTVASIYPLPLQERRPFTPVGLFTLAPAAIPYVEGEYKFIVIPHCSQSTYGGENVGVYPHPIYPIVIANDLKECWCDRVPLATPDACPGVFVCEESKPSKLELSTAYKRQWNWGMKMVEEADAWHRDNKAKYIQPIHRIMAQWLKISDKPWLPEAHGERKACPACQSYIPAAAVVCPRCQTQIAEFPQELARLNQPAPPTSKREPLHP